MCTLPSTNTFVSCTPTPTTTATSSLQPHHLPSCFVSAVAQQLSALSGLEDSQAQLENKVIIYSAVAHEYTAYHNSSNFADIGPSYSEFKNLEMYGILLFAFFL